MMQPTEGYSREELIRAAGEQGVTITNEKLHRWKKTGLLEAPEQLSLGRALGRPAVYPPTALDQVLMIDALLKRSRDIDTARWQLFLGGFQVPLRHLRAQFDRIIARLLTRSEEAATAANTNDVDVEDRYWARLTTRARKRGRSPLFRYVKQMIGGKHLVEFLDLIEQLGSKTLTQMNPEDRSLLFGAISPDLEKSVPEGALASFSGFLAIRPMADAFQRATDETILKARAEFVHVVSLINYIAAVVPGLGPVLALEIQRDPEWPLPSFFLLWLRHRENEQTRSTLLDIAEKLQHANASVLRSPIAGC